MVSDPLVNAADDTFNAQQNYLDAAPTGIDHEDESLLLLLHKRLRGPLMTAKQREALEYEHILVDEAQDLSPVELSVVLATVHVPLAEVPRQLTRDGLERTIALTASALPLLIKVPPRIAVAPVRFSSQLDAV